MIIAGAFYDYEIVTFRFRPPCPRCRRPLWPTRGLNDEEVFRCFIHGWWLAEYKEDKDGHRLPLMIWTRYTWRF
jgi:hypothetical protein